MPKRYSPEFRRRVLELLKAGKSVTEVAVDLGLSTQTIYNWRRQEQIDSGLRPGVSSSDHAELVAARRRIAQLESELAVARRAAELLREAVPPKRRFEAVAVMREERLSVKQACLLLEVTRSGYDAAASRPSSARSIRHAWLTDLITQIHAASRKTYGVPRVHAELRMGRGITIGHNSVAMLMRRAGLQGLPTGKRWRARPDTPTVADLVDRNFAVIEPDALWVTDITEHPTREGKLYCCVVLDAYSRRVVGWSIDSSQTAALVTNALGMAIENREPDNGTTLHSDHGTQFTSSTFTTKVKESGLLASMGTVGDALDNAVVEAFWARRQVELLNRKKWRTRVELANAIFEHLEIFHNRQRRHSALEMHTPIEYETIHQTRQTAALEPSKPCPQNRGKTIAQLGQLAEVVQTDIHVFVASMMAAPSTAAESWLQRIELRHALFPGVLHVDLHPLYNQDEARAVSDAFRRARGQAEVAVS